MDSRYVFSFEEGSADRMALLGGKGANLAEMTRLGFRVPPGFTITTDTCREFFSNGGNFPEGLADQLEEAIAVLESKTEKRFGDSENPLLVSVRSGAMVSMPGMMDTVLNLGMCDEAEKALAAKSKNPRFAADTHRRFIQMFSEVVLGVGAELFEDVLRSKKDKRGISDDVELTVTDLCEIVTEFRRISEEATGKPFPTDARSQLNAAIGAVFESWNAKRAITYRNIHGISHNIGTAVNIQAMVFGNLGPTSATGVLFTRNPATGEKKLFGDFLPNAQGEDVVAGVRTPLGIDELQKLLPDAYAELVGLQEKLERHFCEMQDIEFTIEDGKLYLLQTRTGKRTVVAGVRIAVEMADANLLSKQEAVLKIDPATADRMLHPSLDPAFPRQVITTGIAASPGAASGIVVFSADDAVSRTVDGQRVILVRHETSPEDIHGMHVSEGILTACGGKASHAAVVARGMGKPCVSGAAEIVVNAKAKKFTFGDIVVREGDTITIDGASGEVILGQVPTVAAQLTDEFKKLLAWADDFRILQVRANADTPEDAQCAREFGAEGIGLCRTEHMFFSDERIHHVRRMILARESDERQAALKQLLPYQRSDFEQIFTTMDGLPVTVRLLDPPLHEFLPDKNRDIEALANDLGMTFEAVKDRVKYLSEVNPMLGHRGCRLLITFPDILKMQTRAILEAAIAAQNKGIRVLPEIMVPLVGTSAELRFCRQVIEETAEVIFVEQGERVEYKVGTMIELPRACAQARDIAQFADFFSFGTNDLTQMTFGYSRDDVGQYLPLYLEQGILRADPFETVDNGVCELIRMGVKRGRKDKPELKISVCGEHGGDPESIRFFHGEGFTAVSCSPFRVPIARLAAARATLIQLADNR